MIILIKNNSYFPLKFHRDAFWCTFVWESFIPYKSLTFIIIVIHCKYYYKMQHLCFKFEFHQISEQFSNRNLPIFSIVAKESSYDWAQNTVFCETDIFLIHYVRFWAGNLFWWLKKPMVLEVIVSVTWNLRNVHIAYLIAYCMFMVIK